MLAGHSGAHRPSSHTLNADLGGLWFLFPPGIWSPRNLREFDPSGGGQEVLGRGGVGSEAEQLEAWLEKAEPRLDRGRAVSAGGGDIQGAATASVPLGAREESCTPMAEGGPHLPAWGSYGCWLELLAENQAEERL